MRSVDTFQDLSRALDEALSDYSRQLDYARRILDDVISELKEIANKPLDDHDDDDWGKIENALSTLENDIWPALET
jgi:hypothetical protein